MFDSILDVARGRLPVCAECGARTELQLRFQFGLGAGACPVRVLSAFCPDEPPSWENDGSRITFYPFLVVVSPLESGYENDTSIWLPYWHLVRTEVSDIPKYGQWAPFMDQGIFEELRSKAVAAGLLER